MVVALRCVSRLATRQDVVSPHAGVSWEPRGPVRGSLRQRAPQRLGSRVSPHRAWRPHGTRSADVRRLRLEECEHAVMVSVDHAFRWARIHAVRHMAACENANLRWSETSITDAVISQAAKAVTVVPFTQRAEALSGADWVWWWLDSYGAYGMLVQAKRVAINGDDWKFDFNYPRGSGTQRSSLMAAADAMDLLPVYALYLGTGDYRGWTPCPDGHQSGRCLQCVKRSVSLMPALLAEVTMVNDSTTSYERSVALEDLWNPSPTGALIIPALQTQMAPDLEKFLTTQQDGVLGVTRSMIDQVLRVRYGEFGIVPEPATDVRPTGERDELGPVFGELPDDSGHWAVNYFEHALTPLRNVPPAYVLEIISGDVNEDRLSAEMPDNIAGVVVADLRQTD